jgi:hypothetical protein
MLGPFRSFLIFALGSAVPVTASAEDPDAESIHKTAKEVLAQPGYDLSQNNRLEFDFSFINDFLRSVFKAIQEYFDALAATSPVLAYAVYIGLIVLVLLFIGHIGYSVYRGVRSAPAPAVPNVETKVETSSEFLAEAERLATEGNYVDASRLLYKGALILLEAKRGGRLRQGLTNSEYLSTFRTATVREHLRIFVDLINWKWYRDNTFEHDDFGRCRDAFVALESTLLGMDRN